MASRKKWKRDRRRAEATVPSPKSAGWGQGVPIGRRDIAMIRKAIRGGWQIPMEVRRAILHDLKQLMYEDLIKDEAEANLELGMNVINLAIEMENVNQKAGTCLVSAILANRPSLTDRPYTQGLPLAGLQ